MMLRMLLVSHCCFVSLVAGESDVFAARVEPVRTVALRQIAKRTMLSDYALESNDLRYVTFCYWDDNGKICQGMVLVHKDIAGQLVEYYYRLFDNQVPVSKFNLIESFYRSVNMN